MKTIKPFFKTLLACFKPNAYQYLSAKPYSEAAHYFISLMFVAFVVLTLTLLPFFAGIPGMLSNEFSKFTHFDIDTDIEMTGPAILSFGETLVVVDTTGEMEELTIETALITNETLYYKPFWKVKIYDLESLSVLSDNNERVVSFLWTLIILMLPGLLMMIFLAYLLKYIMVMALAVLVGRIVTHFMRLDVKTRHLIKIAFYSATPMVLGDLLLSRIIPIPVIGSYLIPYGLFGFFFVVGIALNSEREVVHRAER